MAYKSHKTSLKTKISRSTEQFSVFMATHLEHKTLLYLKQSFLYLLKSAIKNFPWKFFPVGNFHISIKASKILFYGSRLSWFRKFDLCTGERRLFEHESSEMSILYELLTWPNRSHVACDRRHVQGQAVLVAPHTVLTLN